MIRTFDEIIKVARERGPSTIAVAVAQDVGVLSAVSQAKAKGIAEAILVGVAQVIQCIALQQDISIDGFEIIDEPDKAGACGKQWSW